MTLNSTAGLLKRARRLHSKHQRDRLDQFLVEGPQAVKTALEARAKIQGLLISEANQEKMKSYIDSSIPFEIVTEADLLEVCNTITPQGIVAICESIDRQISDLQNSNPLLMVYLDQVRDPGNVGAIIRVADAVGASAVLASKGTVDIHNDKVVRSSTGSIFNIDIVQDLSVDDLKVFAKNQELQILVTSADGQLNLLDADRDLIKPTIWVIGNEASGVNPEIAKIADHSVSIPIFGRAESLNAATAAAVCLYASTRCQRALKG